MVASPSEHPPQRCGAVVNVLSVIVWFPLFATAALELVAGARLQELAERSRMWPSPRDPR
jgi:hypothetical protein